MYNLMEQREAKATSVATIDRRMPTKPRMANWQHTFSKGILWDKLFILF
jgi:hypothetical protein